MSLNLIPNAVAGGYKHNRDLYNSSLNDLACMIQSKYNTYIQHPCKEYVELISMVASSDRMKSELPTHFVDKFVKDRTVHSIVDLLAAYETLFTKCQNLARQENSTRLNDLVDCMFYRQFSTTGLKGYKTGVDNGRKEVIYCSLSDIISALYKRTRFWENLIWDRRGWKSYHWDSLENVKEYVKEFVDTFPEPICETVTRTFKVHKNLPEGEVDTDPQFETKQIDEYTEVLVKTVSTIERAAFEFKKKYNDANPKEKVFKPKDESVKNTRGGRGQASRGRGGRN
jgi:hypothetical protein